jgi:hypothetical protein
MSILDEINKNNVGALTARYPYVAFEDSVRATQGTLHLHYKDQSVNAL